MRKLLVGLALSLAIFPALAQNTADSTMAAIQNRDYARAVELATHILENPTITDREKLLRYFQRGFANFMGGHSAEAITDLSKMIDGVGQIYPPADVQTPAYEYRGLSYAMLGKFDESIADLKIVVQRQPGNADALYELGQSYYSAQHTDEAIGAFSDAIKFKPDFATAYADRGENYQNKKEFDRAIADYTEAIRLNPNFAMAYDDRGTALALKGLPREAIKDHERAIALDPSDLHYWNRGGVYLDLGEWQAAIDDLNKAISLTQNSEWRTAMQKSLDKAQQGLKGRKSP